VKIEQKMWTKASGWKEPVADSLAGAIPQLVLVFGGSALVKEQKRFAEVAQMYPKSHVIMMSTAGEIFNTTVSDDSLSVTAIYFEKTMLQFAEIEIETSDQSLALGKKLADRLPKEKLVHVMVFSDGLKVDGTQLVAGITGGLPAGVALTGGLVGDGSDFKHTYVGFDKTPEEGKIVVVGFYGDALAVRYGSMGGWDPFGPEKIITKARGNVLYELDGKPALAIYKEYMGDRAKDQPNSGLFFPLNLRIKTPEGEDQVTRAILGVDEAEQSLTFAGTMPEGVSAQLMKANFERVILASSGAASMVKDDATEAQLAILISCVARKLVLKERTEEETEAIREVFGPNTALTGFYSYGEISPNTPTTKQCQLHNQTMTITTFAER
jgi:hypothetical protein